MRDQHSTTAALIILTAAGIGCGGDGPGPDGQDVLTSVVVTPASPTLVTVAPANTVTLSATGRNQDGATMSGVSLSFSSGDEAIATVDDAALVTAVAEGTVDITVSRTFEGVTETGVASVTVQVAPATAEVDAPAWAAR